ncbi:MAG TPA: hypothetical protein VGG03_07375 [Thermoanaerobaculia bacterium]|jgi:hypothetical protein
MKLKIYSIVITVISVLSIGGMIGCYLDKGWVTFENASYLATIGGTLVGAATLISIAVQLNQQTRLARAVNSQSFVSISSEFVLNISGSDELTELWYFKGETYETLTPVKQARYRYLVQWWLTFYENLQYQRYCDLLDDDVYKAWMKDMDGFIARRHVDKVWDAVKDNYSDRFVEHFQSRIDAGRRSLSTAAEKDTREPPEDGHRGPGAQGAPQDGGGGGTPRA